MKELIENIDKYLAMPKDHKRDFDERDINISPITMLQL